MSWKIDTYNVKSWPHCKGLDIRVKLKLSLRLICLESDEESKGFGSFSERLSEPKSILELEDNLEVPSTCSESSMLQARSCFAPTVDDFSQVSDNSGEANHILHLTDEIDRQKDKAKGVTNKRSAAELKGRTRNTNGEKDHLMNEKKQQKEQEKLKKATLKAEAAEKKKVQKEFERWEKGKFAQQSIVAKIDTKVIEQGSIGGKVDFRYCDCLYIVGYLQI
ncbi:crossover junction endonuclease EME1B-like protein [Tanacetum coccineum]